MQLRCAYAVLKGIEEHKAKGFKPHEVQDKARALADEHLKVKICNIHLQWDCCNMLKAYWIGVRCQMPNRVLSRTKYHILCCA